MGFLHSKAQEVTSKALASIPTDKKDGDVQIWGDRGWTVINGSQGSSPQTFEDFVERGYRQNPVVSACLNALASSMAAAPLRAQVFVDDEWQWVAPDHPAQTLVDVPNSRDSRIELIEKSLFHYMLGGNWFWEKRRSTIGRPIELHPIRPDKVVGVTADKDDMPLAWKIQDDDGKRRTVDALDMLHVADVDPWNTIFGVPRLLSASLEIRTDNEASNYVSEILTNHGQPGMIIGLDKNIKRRQLQRAEDFWEERFGPGRGRGKVAMIAGATQIRQIGFDLRMLEFPDLRIITRESICSVLGVDPILVAIGSASRGGTMSGNEHKEARTKLWKQTIIPIMRRWEAGLDRGLASDFGFSVRYRFDKSEIEALHEDKNKQFERGKFMAETSSFSPEEIRAELGHPEETPFPTLVTSVRTVIRKKEEVFIEGTPDPRVAQIDETPGVNND